MTLFLTSVASEAEAEIAIAGGADLIDFKDAAKGALGALEPEILRAAVASVAGRRPTSAVTGDLPMDPQSLPKAVGAHRLNRGGLRQDRPLRRLLGAPLASRRCPLCAKGSSSSA